MIELKGVTKKFDDFTALDNVDLIIPDGCAFGMLGSNGAGKSTILRLLTGIYSTDGGEVLIDGKPVYNDPSVIERVFFINDETVQFQNYTLKQLKNYFKTFYTSFSEETWDALWNVLKLPLDKKLSTYSKGMKRQAVIICGIACKTDYLLLDEAFDGIDPTMRIIVKKMLVDAMLDRNLTVVISSHNLKEIEEFCDMVAMLHKGRITLNRALDSVKGNVHKVQTAFDGEITREQLTELEIQHFDRSGSVVYIIAKGTEEEIRAALAPYSPKFVDIIPLSLEEVFIYEMEVLGYDCNGIDNA